MANNQQSQSLVITDSSFDWSNGVNSDVTTTIASPLNPNGLKRTQLSWLNNATVRNGGIQQRYGWLKLGNIPIVGQYQGAKVYDPLGADPYLIAVIEGHVWRIPIDEPAAAVDLSAQFGLVHPLTERCYFCQAEEFMVIQSGDDPGGPVVPGTTDAEGHYLPLFWDGARLWRSVGITTATVPVGAHHVNEIPAATAMCYYMGRLWYAQGRTYSAGDIVGGDSAYPFGSPNYYGGRDSVLCVQENPLAVGGDGFTVPSQAGNIRGIAFAANINTQLGQGQLYIGTRQQIYALSVPVSRVDWIAAGNSTAAGSNQMPVQTVALVNNGWVNDRSIVEVNGDLFFQSLEPSIRSLTAAIRNFQQWGNVPISTNENRILQFVDRDLQRFCSGIYFDNRLLETTLPFATPVGVASKAIIPLNFDVISTLEQTLPPCWEGMLEGLNILELMTADFGGRQRAMAFHWSDTDANIQLWELSDSLRFENNESRVRWYLESPAFTWGDEHQLKKLVGGELWFDRLWGEAILLVEYRPDSHNCWYPWYEWKCCNKGTAPTVHYPEIAGRESYRQYQSLPVPARDCNAVMGRPSNVGYQFQIKLSVKGFLRIRGILLHAQHVDRKLYENLVC